MELVEQIEHDTSNFPTLLDQSDHIHATPPPPKQTLRNYERSCLFSSPIYTPFIPSKPSLSKNRDNHLILLPSNDDFTVKAQLTSLYMHPPDYTFRLYDKNQDIYFFL